MEDKHKHTHECDCHCDSCHKHDESACGCSHDHEHRSKEDENREIAHIGVAVVALILSYFMPEQAFILHLAAFISAGWDIMKSAFLGLFKKRFFDETVLMSVASIGAFLIGEYVEASVIMILYRIGEVITEYAVEKSKASISRLSNMRPKVAGVIRNEMLYNVSPDEVGVGEIILVKPGEQIPLDGIVVMGEGFAETAALTGESMPSDIAVGSEVKAGWISKNSLLRIKVTRPFEESDFADMLRIAEHSAKLKARPEKFIKRFARIYTPIMMGVALIVGVIFTLINLNSGAYTEVIDAVSNGVYRGLMILVISCPCALVISIPLGYLGGMGAISRQGILVKGSTTVESLARLSAIAFDKTGTLTSGVFSVKEIICADGVSEADILSAAACAEHHSTHPIAAAIKDKAGAGTEPDSVEEKAGLGVLASRGGSTVAVGNVALMESLGITGLEAHGATSVFVAVDSKFYGEIVLADTLKDNAKSELDALRALGINELYMFTGDREEAAKEVALALNISSYKSALLPAGKVSALEEMLGEGKVVGFVGDGINDAPVLSRADIGFAMGKLGSDAAVEAADAVIATDSLGSIAGAVKAARATEKTVRFNIVFALGVKILFAVLAALGLIGMPFAVFADVGVALIAVLISVSLVKRKF